MAEEPDYYAELGLTPEADEAAIRQAYRQLARRYHPDVAGPLGLPRMRALNAAYAVLGEPARRREYDQRQGFAVAPAPTARERTPSHPPAPRAAIVRVSPGPLARVVALEAPAVPIAALAISGDGTRVGVGLLDGNLLLFETPTAQRVAALDFGPAAGAGVLQELRLSPGGTLVAAWGFSLGLRVWQIPEARLLWNTGISAPSDLVDVALAENPPFACLALPDAPLALASDDPFRWAHEGRGGSAIYYRPLAGVVAPALANPLHCVEAAGGGLLRGGRGETWRVRARVLSASGRDLLTFAEDTAGQAMLAHWSLMRRTIRGAIAPRAEARHIEPLQGQHLPIAATPDLSCVALLDGGMAVRLFTPGERTSRTLDFRRALEDPRLALSPDGGRLALAHGARVELWETHTARCLQVWDCGAEVTALAFGSGTGRTLLGMGLASGLAEVWG